MRKYEQTDQIVSVKNTRDQNRKKKTAADSCQQLLNGTSDDKNMTDEKLRAIPDSVQIQRKAVREGTGIGRIRE